MADRINEEKYMHMIEELHTCATRIYSISSNLQSVASVASSALGEEDASIPGIYKGIRECTLKAANLVEMVRALAATMSREQEAAMIEKKLWENDEE